MLWQTYRAAQEPAMNCARHSAPFSFILATISAIFILGLGACPEADTPGPDSDAAIGDNGADTAGDEGPDTAELPDSNADSEAVTDLLEAPVLRPYAAAPEGPDLPESIQSCAVLDSQRCVAGERERCLIFDLNSGAQAVDISPMALQAFTFDRYYDLYHQVEGQAIDVEFTAPVPPGTPESEWSKPEMFKSMDAYGDASGWTGTALWAAAARYRVTGTDADYARMIQRLSDMMFLYEVTGIPGMIARSHWAMLPEGAPDPVGHWGKAIGHAYPADGSDWHYHYPIGADLLQRLPAYYTEGVTIDGTDYATEGRWQGDASRDMYVRSLPGVMLAYDLLRTPTSEDEVADEAADEISEETRLRGVIRSEIPCTLNRMKKAQIRNLQANPDLLEAVTGFLQGGILSLDDDDLDFTTLDTIVIYVMEQLHPDHPENFDAACPDGPPMTVDPALDFDASEATFLLDLVGFISRLERSSPNPIVFPMAVSVRTGDLIHMVQWATTAFELTGDARYQTFLNGMIAELPFEGILMTAGAFSLPKWCTSHYAPSLTYPSVYNVGRRLQAEGPTPFATLWARMARDEFRDKEMAGLGDAFFGMLYSGMVRANPGVLPPVDQPTAGADDNAYAAANIAILRGYGMNPADPLDPDRNYTRDWVTNPPPGLAIEELPADSKEICEKPVEVLGMKLEAAGVSDENPRAVAALPLSMRVGGGFNWTQDPWKLVKNFGAGQWDTQFPMVGMTAPYWIGRADGVIDDGPPLALGWSKVGGDCTPK